ncbi:MAG TPA: rhomboid family intramembrane serine protease [Bacteroidia bacterium]
MSNQEYRPTGFNVLPPVVKNLLIINGIFFLATVVFELKMKVDLTDLLGLHYFGSEKFRPHQIVTYMFMHAGFSHILFNMFALWMFGNALENYWGGKRFLIFYIVCGLGAALTHYVIFYFQIRPVLEILSGYLSDPQLKNFEAMFQPLLSQHLHNPSEKLSQLIDHYNSIPDMLGQSSEKLQASIELVNQFRVDFLDEPTIIGASGAVFGVLLAFGMLFPNSMIYIYFLFPIKAKWFVIIYGAIELFGAVNQTPGDNIAHYAHLGGMLFGFILIKVWNRSRKHFY